MLKSSFTLKIKTPQETSLVFIGKNVFNNRKIWSLLMNLASFYVIITDSYVRKILDSLLFSFIKSSLLPQIIITIPPGERYKNYKTKEAIENLMVKNNINKNSCVIAIGGGVITDLAGFIASTYHRGLPLINIPTSLVGMIDAGLGGKVGINSSLGYKNIIGNFKNPSLVFCDISFLQFLPHSQILNGLAEAIKYALIYSRELFSFLEENVHSEIENYLPYLVQICCDIKIRIVKKDPKEQLGLRSILNFGHTIGHALEACLNIDHGQAVAFGLKVETLISLNKGNLDIHVARRILSLINTFYPQNNPNVSSTSLIEAMTKDKKNLNSQIHCVLIKDIGRIKKNNSSYTHPVDIKIIETSLKQVLSKTDVSVFNHFS